MIFLGLGSNLGDKTANLQMALQKLGEKGVAVLRISTILETPPWGFTEQDSFMNLVAEVGFDGTPESLLSILLGIENEMGRVREIKWGPRLIDLDILDFHRQIVQTETLSLPHPHYHERDFVMIPLRELEPDWVEK